jgi:hypothetical protein
MVLHSGRLQTYSQTLDQAVKALNTNIYSYLETSGGKSSDLYLNAVHIFNTRVS